MTDRKQRPDTGVRDPRGRFGAGNAGRPRGARNKINQRLEALFAQDAEAVVAATIEAARGGDTAAMSLVLNRIFPAAKDRPIVLDLPAAPAEAARAIVVAVTAGEILLGDAERLMALIKAEADLASLKEIEARIAALEGAAR
jgi:hypothetical protein